MAHYCPYCEVIFDRPRSNCPLCGGRPQSNQQPDSQLEAEGYRYYTSGTASGRTSHPSEPTESTDFYSRLQTRYQTQQQNPPPASVPRTDSPDSTSLIPPRSEPAQTAAPPVIPEVESGSFFSQFGRGDDPIEVPEEIPWSLQDEEAAQELAEHSAAVRSTSRQARRARFQARWAGQTGRTPILGNRGLRWLIWVLIIILALIFLWLKRFAIAAAIWEIISAFMPIIIIILGILWLIRPFFRRK